MSSWILRAGEKRTITGGDSRSLQKVISEPEPGQELTLGLSGRTPTLDKASLVTDIPVRTPSITGGCGGAGGGENPLAEDDENICSHLNSF